MSEEDLQAVLRCGQCNKPFDKESTLKRHGYYCRSRRTGRTNRSRSCISCARGKTRCDNKRPECSKCIHKAIECHYPTNTGQGIQHSDDAPTQHRVVAPSLVANPLGVEYRQGVSKNAEMSFDSTLAMPKPGCSNHGGDYFDWNDPNIDFNCLLGFQMNEETIQSPLSRSLCLTHQATTSTDQPVQVPQALTSPKLSISALSTYTLRSLIQRPKIMTGARRTANLMLCTLKSYPLMMMRHNTLPPFIHPRLMSSSIENNHIEPLTNCVNLVHMISSGAQGSRKLFWKNVRLECERLYGEHPNLNKWELLAAMQALSVYILIRLDEGETDHNNLDYLLIATVAVMSQQFGYIDVTSNAQSEVRKYGLESSWTDWIFEESRRRLCVVYRVVNMLVYFEPASMCELQTDLIMAPLPAKKQLWEASDEFMWKTENERDIGAQTTFGLAANGDLVKLSEGQLYCNHALLFYEGAASWEDWCSGMDGFGGLVMLAASLIV